VRSVSRKSLRARLAPATIADVWLSEREMEVASSVVVTNAASSAVVKSVE